MIYLTLYVSNTEFYIISEEKKPTYWVVLLKLLLQHLQHFKHLEKNN